MKNTFYHHLVVIDPIHTRFDELGFDSDQRERFIHLLHQHIHYTVIDIVLSELTDEKKKEFLHLLVLQDDATGAWEFVAGHIEDSEAKLRHAISEIIDGFRKDLELKDL